MDKQKFIRLALPKGSLQQATISLMEKAGFHFKIGTRAYQAECNDPEIKAVLIRPQEMPRYVAQGVFDAGITGLDWVKENNAEVVEVETLSYSKSSLRPVKWVVAVPNDSSIKSVKDLQGKRIATELVNISRQYLAEQGVEAEVEFSWGATEVKPPELCDAIIELTETGSSLRANNLRVVDVVMESCTKLIANKSSWQDDWKRKKIENIGLLLRSAIDAVDRVGLKMNVPKSKLEAITKLLPAITAPTVSPLADEDWVALETILQEQEVRQLIPELKRAGATGIIEYPLNKVII
ncbi:ATP phosphoribosyltransferase [Candidatus Sumerlaeota bacterium]|nr:ATP phosphoribosyltransferase [Candidatus Sumerlaeota bacterium]